MSTNYNGTEFAAFNNQKGATEFSAFNNEITVDPSFNGVEFEAFSNAGYNIIVESPGKNTSTKELSRRITRTPTLDGGAAFYYGGFTHADRTISIEIDNATGPEVAASLALITQNNNVQVQNAEGVFLCAIERVTVKDSSVSFKFLVKEKVA